eukprot:gene3144-5460_t
MGKVNNFTGAKKIHLVYLFGYSSLFYDYGLESINERNYIAYGPAKAGITLGELCSEKEFGDIFNTTLNLTDKEMCENIYCQSTYKIENFTSSNQRRVFMHCHVCLTRFRQSFVEKVKNGSCHWSNEFYKPWEKCGKIMEYEGDLLPYAQLFLIIATFLLLTFALLGLTIFLVRDVITLSNFDPGITFQILIFFWVTISEFLCLVVSVLLWVYTVRMFSILSVQHDNFRDKLKYFFQLKFSQLTILLNISNFITMIFVAVFCAGFFFPGTFSWELTLFSPYLLYCCILINVLIILFGMTNWRNCRQIYCCACSKCFKNESDDEKSDDDNEKSDNQKE